MENSSKKTSDTSSLDENPFAKISIVTLLLNPQTGAIVYANPAACKFYGYTLHKFRMMNISELNPKPLAETLENLQMAYSGERDYYITRHKTARGTIRPVGIYTGPFDIDNQHLLVAMVHDVSLRMEMEEKLKTLSLAVEQSPASIVITDISGKIEYVNPIFSEVTGYTFDEAIGNDPRILKTGEGNREEIRLMWETILSGQIWHGEFCNRKKNGDIYWESASISPVINDSGKIIQFVAVKQDITEIKESQTRIAEALKLNQAIRDTSPIGVVIYKATGQCILANPAAGTILGADWSIIQSQNFNDLQAWKDYGILAVAMKALEIKEPVSTELFYVSTFGKELWMDIICAPFVLGGEEHLLFMFEDFSSRKKTETSLQEAKEQMEEWVRQLEKRNHSANVLRDMGEMLQVCNTTSEAFDVIEQFGPQQFPDSRGGVYLIGQVPHMVELSANWGGSFASEPVFNLDNCWSLRRGQIHFIQAGSSGMRCKHISSDFNGSYLGVPMTAMGDLIGLLYIEWPAEVILDEGIQELAQNVSEHLSLSLSNIKLRETLRNQSIRDPLTGVFNRRYMEETLEREIPRARRKKTSVGIMMMDIDHFKIFNDTFGHDAGDFVLKSLTKLLQSKVRGEDIVCRFGGEEFVLIMPETNLEIIYQRAEDIRKDIAAQKLSYEQKSLGPITISIGVAVFPEHGETGNNVLQSADEALYRAKNQGRNRVVKA